MRIGTRKTAAKIFASVVLVGGAASVAGLGTFGGFTSTTTASEATGTGRVELSSASGVRGLDIAATGMVPGDTAQRTITLTRSSDTQSFGSVTLTTTSAVSNLLTTDTAKGLQLKIDQCPVAWVKAAGSNDLTCPSGADAPVLASRAVIGSPVDLGAATAALNSNDATAYLRATLTLPAAAGNEFQGLSNTVKFTFDATQRAASSL
jgi:spore coat-associated protein N